MPGVAKTWKRRGKEWAPGDLDFPAKLKTQKPGGAGGWVYLTQEHLAAAIHGSGGRFESVDPDTIVARRSVLDPGTGQILIRLKKE